MGTTERRTDRDWRERFTLEARMLDLSGAQIGDALAVIEEHLAESGEPAPEAFGDPVAYAASLAEATPKDQPEAVGRREVAGALAGVIGLWAVSVAAGAAVEGTSAKVSLGSLLVVAIAVIGVGVFLLRPTQTLRWLTGARWIWVGLGAVALEVLLVGVLLLAPNPIAHVSVQVAGPVAAGLVIGATWALWPLAGGDPIRDPRTGEAPASRALTWVTALLFPILSVLVVAMTWLTSALG